MGISKGFDTPFISNPIYLKRVARVATLFKYSLLES